MAADYYSLLGVARSATPDEIKKAFRTKAHQFHPDKSTGDAVKFKEINEAYQVLSDPAKRQQYDQFGQTYDQARRQGQAGPGGLGDFSGFGNAPGGAGSGFAGNVDFGDLGDIFGDLFGFGQRQSRPERQRGHDIQAAIRLDFRTAAFGGEQQISLKHLTLCEYCQGQGAEPGSGTTTCSTCQGSGQVSRVQRTILGNMQSVQVCPTCGGEGRMIKQPCVECHGEGRREKTETITVKIPAGIAAGQRVKLSGKGEAGRRGQPPGDLYLAVDVASDPHFKRDDDDILSTATIPLSTAVLGGMVSVGTLDGDVNMKIPAGSPSGKVFLLKGKGIPHLRGRGRGDQRVTVEVDIPKTLSAKAKKLLKELQEQGL